MCVRWWPNSIYSPVCSIATIIKDVYIYQYVIYLSNNLYYVVLLGIPMVRLGVYKFPRVHSEVPNPK